MIQLQTPKAARNQEVRRLSFIGHVLGVRQMALSSMGGCALRPTRRSAAANGGRSGSG
ncbi:hypothetical protein C7M71_011230 [Peterkaempfera bronchialis]|uniref:Uncharacterized protein n=1 Tax=Peterkaempfera bronchialis TaxID=2126346 RepID=A0A345SW20_9ACTN|nr:hypothetical protein C7M71_011230 [Peterkaempfera bronchialis]